MEFFHKVTRFPFMHTRKVWYALSVALILASLSLVAIRGLNLGVDFTGGVVVETSFPQAPNIEQLRTALAKSGVDAPPTCEKREAEHSSGRPDRRPHPGGVRQRG